MTTVLCVPGVRNAMLWRVPGQTTASQGLNMRMVESIDIFPTIVELTGTPALPKCKGLDQPPTTLCLQGESYASEFMVGNATPAAPKKYAFSQWPFPKWGNETGLRQGYTVRSAAGYRYTQYVPYDTATFTGNWSEALDDDSELYDYNNDKWETTNFAAVANYSHVVAELKVGPYLCSVPDSTQRPWLGHQLNTRCVCNLSQAVLYQQYAPSQR